MPLDFGFHALHEVELEHAPSTMTVGGAHVHVKPEVRRKDVGVQTYKGGHQKGMSFLPTLSLRQPTGSKSELLEGAFEPKRKAGMSVTLPTPHGPITLPTPPEVDLGGQPTAATLDFLTTEYLGTRLPPYPHRYNR